MTRLPLDPLLLAGLASVGTPSVRTASEAFDAMATIAGRLGAVGLVTDGAAPREPR